MIPTNGPEVNSLEAFGELGERAELERMDRAAEEIAKLPQEAREQALLGERDRRQRWAESRVHHLSHATARSSSQRKARGLLRVGTYFSSRLRQQWMKIRASHARPVDEETALEELQ